FPNLARFAEDATWYRNHTGIATATQQAIPSMLSSMLPRNAKPILADHPQNLFTLLAPTHKLEVSESMTALCAFAHCSTIEGPGWWEQVATLRRDVFEIWTERIGLGPPAAPDLADFAEVVDGSDDGAAPTVDLTTGTDAPARFSELLATI